MDRIELNKKSKKRVRLMSFGDPVTNICAGMSSPRKYSYFVELKNNCVRCTDKKGEFWDTMIDVVYPGILNKKECSELWEPTHATIYGVKP